MQVVIAASVQEFVRGLQKPTISKFARMVDLLVRFGHDLSMPYSKKISRDLFELRLRGKQEVRIFYMFYQGQAVLLHGFVKKTQKTPLHEIEAAKSKRKTLTDA